MQQTRRYILEILRERGEATVDEMVSELKTRIQHNITAVTVRHHLDILRSDNLVTAPTVRRSGAPGRPQYVYALTDKALEVFPNNYQNLMTTLLTQMKSTLPEGQVNVIFEGVADQMVVNAHLSHLSSDHMSMDEKLTHVVNYLNENGYNADWESSPEGYILHNRNCPYHKVSDDHSELCNMDFRLIAGLIGIAPRAMTRLSQDEEGCSFLIPASQQTTA